MAPYSITVVIAGAMSAQVHTVWSYSRGPGACRRYRSFTALTTRTVDRSKVLRFLPTRYVLRGVPFLYAAFPAAQSDLTI